MKNRIDILIKAFANAIQGTWNSVGIIGRLIIIFFSPIIIIVLLTLWTFRFGFILIQLMANEVNFYWNRWIKATIAIKELLDELISKKILTLISYLWNKLFDESYSWDINKNNKLSNKWFYNLFSNFLKQGYLFGGILLIITSLSSLIYSISSKLYHFEVSYILLWLFRLFLLVPVLHRIIRYKLQGKKFSLKPEISDNNATMLPVINSMVENSNNNLSKGKSNKIVNKINIYRMEGVESKYEVEESLMVQLFSFRDGEKFGYKNSKGDIVIPCIYDTDCAHFFIFITGEEEADINVGGEWQRQAPYKSKWFYGGKWSKINIEGEILLPFLESKEKDSRFGALWMNDGKYRYIQPND